MRNGDYGMALIANELLYSNHFRLIRLLDFCASHDHRSHARLRCQLPPHGFVRRLRPLHHDPESIGKHRLATLSGKCLAHVPDSVGHPARTATKLFLRPSQRRVKRQQGDRVFVA